MRTLSIFAAALPAALLAPALGAQCSVTSGSPIGSVGDDTITTVTTSFPVLFCDGTSTTSLVVDSNGRVYPNTGTFDSTDLSESVAELMNDPHPTVAGLWTDLDPVTFGNVFVQEDPVSGTVFLIWDECEYYAGGTAFDMQVELRTDGSWAVLYDDRVPPTLNGAIVGCSPGNGHADPGGTDLGVGVADSFGNPAIYEHFPAGAMDLAGKRIDFYPTGPVDGANGFVAVTTDCFASAEAVGSSCVLGTVAWDWVPDGMGGYVVVPSSNTFDSTNLGASQNHTDDSTRTANLGFNFTMPGGLVVSSVDVNSNGRIVEVGSDFADYTPTVAEFLSASGPGIAPFWTDWNVYAGGDIRFFTDNVGYASVTWDDVHQYGNPAEGMTMQIQLHAPDTWTVILQDVEAFDPTVGFGNGQALLIGCSSGNGAANPGETDVSTGLIVTNGNPTQYEFFDPMADVLDLAAPSMSFVPITTPQIGGTFQSTLSGIPATTMLGGIMMDFVEMNTPLSVIWPGNPCVLNNPGGLFIADFTALGWAPGATGLNLTIDLSTAGPALAGITLYMQALIGDMTLPWAGGLPVATSNTIRGAINY